MANPHYWARAAEELALRDPVLAPLTARCQGLVLGSRGDAFSTLARAIVGQQISTKAADSVWARFRALAGEVSPARIVRLDAERLRACGLSGRKSSYLLDLAMRFETGLVDPQRWSAWSDETLIAELTQVKGIGRWTAEMFLIFHMARPDVLPLDDLGLQRAMSLLYNRGRPLARTRMQRIARAWSPWRSVATWYLWRSLDPVPLQY
jgi:DNA-3-methyladenine glycosylase II